MGRPPSILPPPRAWKASGTIPDLLQADDLKALPQTERRSYLPNANLHAAATELNAIFESYALWAAGEHSRATRSERRNWFEQINQLAVNMRYSLGLDQPDLHGASFEDVLLHMIATNPFSGSATESSGEERYAQHKLEHLARIAAPEAYAIAKRQGRSPLTWEIVQEIIGDRFHATLAMVQMLSDRGKNYYGARLRKGGQSEKARKELFTSLAGQYERLFGRLPKIALATPTTAEQAAGERRQSVPKGHVLNWFLALLNLIGSEAERALSVCKPDGLLPNPEREKLLLELKDLASTASESKAKDGPAHWIRDGAATWAKRPPPEVSAPDPDYKPTPLEKLFE